ncbi:MAG TPA: ComF family protein [Vicinamibacterales bacterium]|mgnify:CR=1 FL=1|nr:ComF family protein [Vicinamibacterales bacterium]
MTLRDLANLALSRIFAPPCVACGHPIPQPLDGAVCEACWSRVVPFTPPLCANCGIPLASWRAAEHMALCCARCHRNPGVLDRQAAVGPYEGVLRDVLHALKYDGRRSVAPMLSVRMRSAGRDLFEAVSLAVPVPLHRRRQWRRGFNQADLLAVGLGLPTSRLLRRVRATPPQVTLPAAARRHNVRDAFRLSIDEARRITGRADTRLDGLVLMLVDDVATTGATLEACARVLKEAGADEVRAVTAARVVSAPRR